MIYDYVRPILFLLPPETAHRLSLLSLQAAYYVRRLMPTSTFPLGHSKTVMGLTFPNVVGIAAGLDKNGDYIDALAMLNPGSIEIGTVTLKPQAGNPKPRLFRLTKDQALINRMGFNSRGVDYVYPKYSTIFNGF